jgi:hypothetical protein
MSLSSLWRIAEAQAIAGYDLIGDVHGRADKLIALLKHLGYRDQRGAWRHSTRQAIFVGDLIDRGPQEVQTVDIVRRMVEADTARCILGNHEFNAIAWATRDPAKPGEFLRAHSKSNLKQHVAFLAEVEGRPQHAQLIDWFKSLPLWLELPGVRVAHACWHQDSIELLTPLLRADGGLTEDLVLRASRQKTPEFKALEIICKGPHLDLPPGVSFEDQDGKVREEVRLRWWLDDLKTYRDAGIGPSKEVALIPDTPIPAHLDRCTYSGMPVVFGHYWFSGDPQVISPKFACVDFSAAYHGPLVAYRFDGESELQTAKLDWVSSLAHPR